VPTLVTVVKGSLAWVGSMKDKISHIVSSEQMIEQCVRDMKLMLSEHGYFNFEIKRGNRSLSQNALYWVWMPHVAKQMNKDKVGYFDDDLGEMIMPQDYDEDDAHLVMKKAFLGQTDPIMKGDTIVVPPQVRSTKKLNKGEMMEYMQRIEAWMATKGVYLPIPSDCQYELNKKRQVT
jgi:hypothetical protein